MKLTALFACVLFPVVASAGPATWQLDTSHSKVSFVAKHLAFAKVRGEFREFTGTVKADDKTGKIETLDGVVKVKSISTDNKDRDGHLLSDDFFNAEKFPEMKLSVKKVTWNGNEFTADGELTIRDVTKAVQFKGEQSPARSVNFGGPTSQLRTGYSATTKINRKDFNLKWNKLIEGTSVVSDEITIEIDTELYLEGDKAKK